MKFLCAVVLCAVALQAVAATNVVARLKEEIEAKQIGSSMMSSSMPVSISSSSSMGSVSASMSPIASSISTVSSSGSCGSDPCSDNAASTSSAPMNVEDALAPVADWIKDFKRRTSGAGANDLYAAARATVAPLINQLKKNQAAALQQLTESNEAILRHVEDATTQHIFALLKVDREKQQQEEAAQSLAAKAKDMAELEKLRAERDAAVLGAAAKTAGVSSSLASAGVSASADVVSKIASIIASASQSSK